MQGGRRPPGPETIELVRGDHDNRVPAADCHPLRLASRRQPDDFAESCLGFRKLPAGPRRIRGTWYDFVRPHGSLHGMTSAMALGLAETFWPLDRLLP